MSKAAIQLVYDGPALRDKTMDVRELAPALLAMGDLLEGANEVLNGKRAKVAVHVRADFRSGSFGLDFDVIQTVTQQLQAFLSGHHIYSATQLLELLGLTLGVPASIITIVRFLRGRAIGRTVHKGENIVIYVEGSDNSLEVTHEVINLWDNAEIRTSALGILLPLERQGIDTFRTAENNKTQQEIGKSELPHFRAAASYSTEPTTLISRQTMLVYIHAVVLEGSRKWSLSDGTATFSAEIADEGFLRLRDEGQVSFTRGDRLLVEMETKQTDSAQGLKTERIVRRIVRHIKAGKQTELPFSEPPDGSAGQTG